MHVKFYFQITLQLISVQAVAADKPQQLSWVETTAVDSLQPNIPGPRKL